MKPWYWCADDGTVMTAQVDDDVVSEVGSGCACYVCGALIVGVRFRDGDGGIREFDHGCGWHPLPSKWAEVSRDGRRLNIVVAPGRVVARLDGTLAEQPQ